MCLAHPPITRQHLAHMMGLRRQARDPPDVPPAHREHGGGGMTVESGRRKERERERERKREKRKYRVCPCLRANSLGQDHALPPRGEMGGERREGAEIAEEAQLANECERGGEARRQRRVSGADEAQKAERW